MFERYENPLLYYFCSVLYLGKYVEYDKEKDEATITIPKTEEPTHLEEHWVDAFKEYVPIQLGKRIWANGVGQWERQEDIPQEMRISACPTYEVYIPDKFINGIKNGIWNYREQLKKIKWILES